MCRPPCEPSAALGPAGSPGLGIRPPRWRASGTSRTRLLRVLLLVALIPVTASHPASLQVSPWFGHNMVLQQASSITLKCNAPNSRTLSADLRALGRTRLEGTASPGDRISARLIGSGQKDPWQERTRADESGNWSLDLDGLKPGGPYALEVLSTTGSREPRGSLSFTNVVVGDLFVFSGRPTAGNQALQPGGKTAPAFDRDSIRFVSVADYRTNPFPVAGRWQLVDFAPQRVLTNLPGVAFQLGRLLATNPAPHYIGLILVPPGSPPGQLNRVGLFSDKDDHRLQLMSEICTQAHRLAVDDCETLDREFLDVMQTYKRLGWIADRPRPQPPPIPLMISFEPIPGFPAIRGAIWTGERR